MELRQNGGKIPFSCTITQNCRSIANQEEVDSDRNHNQFTLSRGRTRAWCVSVSGTNKRRRVCEVEFTCTRDVDVTRRVVRAWEQVELNHNSALIAWRSDVVTAISVWRVVREELRLEVLVDRDTVSGDLDRIHSLGRRCEGRARRLRNNRLRVGRRREVCRGQSRWIGVTDGPDAI